MESSHRSPADCGAGLTGAMEAHGVILGRSFQSGADFLERANGEE